MARPRLFASLLANEKGNVLLIGAATLPLLIGSAALAVDTIQLSLAKRQLQRAADSSALAGAYAIVQGKSASAAVTRDLQINDKVSVLGTPDVQHAPTAGPYSGNTEAVRVVLSTQRTVPFMSFFVSTAPVLTTEATAMVVRDGSFCMFAEEEGAITAIDFNGNPTLDLGCGMSTNSRAAVAIDAGGAAKIVATPIVAVGGLPLDNAKFSGSTMMPYSAKQKDPFADRPDPSAAADAMDCSTAVTASTVGSELNPGCFSSWNISSTVKLNAGTYYIKNGNVNFGSHANVTGDGVTIVFTGDGDSIGKFDMDGQAKINLKAPKTGDYKGIVFFRDNDRLTMDTLMINGGADLKIEGAMYFPNTHLWFNGNSDVAADCLQIVGRRLTFKGGMKLKNDCSAGYGENFQATYVKLVG